MGIAERFQLGYTLYNSCFSSINPTDENLTELDIATAIVELKHNASEVVIGYVHLGISRSELLDSIRPVVINVFLTILSLIVFLGILLMLITHQFSVALAKLTHEVTSGKCEEPVMVGGGSEFKQIASLLNSAIGITKHQKSEALLSKEILNRKMDERASQLSQRDEELSTATREIDKTKGELRQLAYYDSLTSLPNRRLFSEQLAMLLRLNERNKTSLALVFINLDNFKRINESLGHLAGDTVLREVAARLALCLRGSDTIAVQNESKPNIDISRLGGDEFTVVLNQFNSIHDISVVVQRLLETLVEPMTIEGTELVIAPNIGIAIAPNDADQVQGLFTAASAAMLELGLTETIMSDRNESTVAALQELKDIGIYLSVDDFGNSYSPMSYLSHYPLDEVKIDRRFVANCDKDEGEGRLVTAIVSMADSLDLKIVAEGVETEEQFRFLRSKGSSVMQGYLFSEAVSADLLEPMLTPWYFAEQVRGITL